MFSEMTKTKADTSKKKLSFLGCWRQKRRYCQVSQSLKSFS